MLYPIIFKEIQAHDIAKEGNTALHYAAAGGHTEICQLLLESVSSDEDRALICGITVCLPTAVRFPYELGVSWWLGH